MVLRRLILLPIACLSFNLWHARALGTNRTIDDENGDSVTGAKPVYAGMWNYGPTCQECGIQLDPDSTFDQSWHDTTASPTDTDPTNVTFSFTGTALWINCAVANYDPFANILTNLSFELDGQTVGTYTHTHLASQSTEYLYNVTVFSAASLDNAEHTMVITPRRDVNASVMLFDWAMYTFESDSTPLASSSSTIPPSSSSSSATPSSPVNNVHVSQTHLPAIIGGVIAVASALLLVLLVGWLRRRRRLKMDRIAETRLAPASEMDNATQGTPCIVPRLTSQSVVDRDLTTLSPLETDFAADLSLDPFNVITSQSMFPADRPRRERRSRRHKVTTRRTELTQQMEIIERHVANLQERRDTATECLSSGTQTAGPSIHTNNRRTSYELELRRRIEALQLEVERLRLEATTVNDDPPPAYKSDYDEVS